MIIYHDQNGVPYNTEIVDALPQSDAPEGYMTDAAVAPDFSPDPVADEQPADDDAGNEYADVYVPPVDDSGDQDTEEFEPVLDVVDDPEPYVEEDGETAYTEPEVDEEEVDNDDNNEEYSYKEPSTDNVATGLGISYAPYADDHNCKTRDQIARDFDRVDEFGNLRIYGTDCDQVGSVVSVAKDKGMKVFLGIFDIDNIEEEAQLIIDGASDCWECVHTISIGNELVQNGMKSAGQVVAAMDTARGILSSAGYNGAIVTVDTVPAVLENPQLCERSDYAAVNCHAYFDGGVEASGAGDFVSRQRDLVAEACGGKKVRVTESGWPHQGKTNGKAIPSCKDQQLAIQSLKEAFADSPEDLYIFTLRDERWKRDKDNEYKVEQFWGMCRGH